MTPDDPNNVLFNPAPTTLGEQVKQFNDTSAKYTTENVDVTSNKAEVVPIDSVVETVTSTSSFNGTAQGISGDMRSRVSRAQEIVAGGVEAGDTEFQIGVNQIVTLPNGKRYIAQVPESEINIVPDDAVLPDDLAGLI